MSYGDLIYGKSPFGLLYGSESGLLFSDAIAPLEIKQLLKSGVYGQQRTDAASSGNWATYVTDAITSKMADADTITAYTVPLDVYGSIAYSGGTTTYQARWAGLGRVKFTLPTGLRGSLTRMQLRCVADMRYNNADYDLSGLNLNLVLSESATAYTLGSDLLAATPDAEASFIDINDSTNNNGNGAREFHIDLPVAGINAYSSDTFYLWFAAEIGTVFPYPGDPSSSPNTRYYECRVILLRIGLEA